MSLPPPLDSRKDRAMTPDCMIKPTGQNSDVAVIMKQDIGLYLERAPYVHEILKNEMEQ